MTLKQIHNTSNIQNISNPTKQTKKGKLSSSITVEHFQRVGSGILATICAIAAIITLPISVPTYAVLRLVDQKRGIKFKGLEPVDSKDKSLSIYPLYLTKTPVIFAKGLGHFAINGDKTIFG